MKQQVNSKTKNAAATVLEEVPAAELKEILQLLPAELSTVLYLYFFEQLSIEKIAQKIERSRTTAGKRLQQGLYYLDRHLDTPVYQQAQQILYGKQPNRVSF